MKTDFKTCFKKTDKILLVITLLLFLVGTLNLVNASSFEVNAGGDLYYYLKKHLFFLAVGTIATYIIINKVKIKSYRYLFYLGFAFIFGLVCFCFTQDAERGAQNWIEIAGTSIQPSEFSKPIIIVGLASLFSKWDYMVKRNISIDWFKEFIKFGVIGGLIPCMVILQHDLGSASIIAVIALSMFFASSFPKIWKVRLAKFLGIMASIVFVLIITKSSIIPQYQLDRFTSLFTPCSNYEDEGYQVCNALIALNSGGIDGLGIGKSKQKYSYIPEPHTDSVFAIVGEELGFFIGTFFIILIFLVIFRIYKSSRTVSDPMGRYICLGVSWYIFIHTALNLGGLMALIPLTGVPLPFFSYGGSFTLCLICSLALVQRVIVEDKLKPIKI